ncbi:toxin VasX [Stutzerimonas nitrititolerans]|uniref:toxin VasX n=1 Tax=Stutzerimonas nitrititolerans TaxID=2482751 RepID=UPI0028AB5EDE|nr:toxin VasX [Stutzerimonas nitrititolerans]
MTAQTSTPSSLSVAGCPLLSAVLPLRYALGPTLAVDTSAYGLPPVQGDFPAIGEYFEPLKGRTLNYTARLLRDGWLYIWQSGLKQLVEYRVSAAVLTQTARGGKVIDSRRLPYLLLPAGAPAMLAWSPRQWNDSQYNTAKGKEEVRQRVMRTITPGAAPFGGQVRAIHERIGDYMDADWYGWSCEPSTSHRPAWPQLLEDMQRCEQQSYALIDDPWGVLLDLAELLRARQQAVNVTREVHGEDWAMAGVLKSLAESDSQIGGQLRSMTNYRKLQTAWQEQAQEENTYSADVRRLSELWSAWLNTMAQRGPASLDTACGHFDITQTAPRTELELHFAAACLGPATTGPGAQAIANALTLQQQAGKPWLVWSLLGLGKRLSIGEINAIVGLADGARDNGGTALTEARKVAQLLNQMAEKLAGHIQWSPLEALFTALAPVAGVGLQQANDGTKAAGRLYLAAALARSQQRLAIEAVSQRQVGEWMSDLMGTRPQLPTKLRPTQLSVAVSDALPFFRLLPAKDLPALTGYLAADINLKGMLDLSKGAMEKAPVKCLVALVAGLNFVWGVSDINKNSLRSSVNALAGLAGAFSATSAIAQKVAEVDWEATTKVAGSHSLSSQAALAKALGVGAKTAFGQSVTSGFDVMVFSIEALESYQAGDLDTASINTGLTLASAANLRLYVQSFRAVRAARAAVIAGEAAAIGRGISVVPHLATRALGWTLLIVGGVIARQYTQDTPLEAWVKRTRFGIRPADWADSYEESMTELYKILFPISFQAYRLNELNPYHGMQAITYVLLRLPGRDTLTDEMIHFKGHETWGTFLGFGGTRKAVEWTGRDFDHHGGTRVGTEPGVAVYRRVYHEKNGDELDAIHGELSYSPMEGLTLPPIEIKELAWL